MKFDSTSATPGKGKRAVPEKAHGYKDGGTVKKKSSKDEYDVRGFLDFMDKLDKSENIPLPPLDPAYKAKSKKKTKDWSERP